MWAVLTRLEQPKHANLTLLQKLKLYNGKTLPGFTEDNVVELKREAVNEGMHGISPRYIQDKISNAIVAHPDEDCVNPFMVMHELEVGLRAPLAHHQSGAIAALPRTVGGGQGGVRGHREKRSAARHRRRRGRPDAAVRPTTSTTSRPTRSAKRCATATPATTRSRMND